MWSQAIHRYALHVSFCFILTLKKMTELWLFMCQDHLVTSWHSPLTCDLKKSYLLRSSLVIYDLEIWLWYLCSFPRYWTKNLPWEPLSPKHEYRGQYSFSHPVTSVMTSSWSKCCFRKISHKPEIMTVFVSMLYDENWPSLMHAFLGSSPMSTRVRLWHLHGSPSYSSYPGRVGNYCHHKPPLMCLLMVISATQGGP